MGWESPPLKADHCSLAETCGKLASACRAKPRVYGKHQVLRARDRALQFALL
jgi:hypothetical protein